MRPKIAPAISSASKVIGNPASGSGMSASVRQPTGRFVPLSLVQNF
jgi:hypothetical protein